DTNLKEGLLKSTLSQSTCLYKEYIHRTVSIPGCPKHINPFYSYPVAMSCECGKCNTDNSDCIHDIIKTNYCTVPKKSHYVGFSKYIH
ncbi:hypothetical protein FKM82_026362, partial [Ascaphus truei]